MIGRKIKSLLAAGVIVLSAGSVSANTIKDWTFSATDTTGGQNVTVTATMLIEDTATSGVYRFTLTNTSATTLGVSNGILAGFALDYTPGDSMPVLTNDYTGEANSGGDLDWTVKSVQGNSLSNTIAFDFCATAKVQGSCTGAGSGIEGLASGQSSFFEIAFNPDVVFSYGLVRFQAVGPNGGSQKIVDQDCVDDPDCFPGTGPQVPLPAGLPLMLTAIGIGAYMRKRSRKSA